MVLSTDNQPLDLLEKDVEQGSISLTQKEIPSRTPEGVQEISTIAKGAGSEREPEEISRLYEEGYEEVVEQELQAKRDTKDKQTRFEMVEEMVANKDPNAIGVLEQMYYAPETTKTNIHREYARQTVSTIALNSLRVEKEEPEEVDIAMDAMEVGTEMATRVRELSDKVKAKWEEKSTISKVGSVAATFIPFATWAVRNDAVDVETQSSFLPGNNLSEQIEAVWKVAYDQGPDAAIALLEEAVEDVSTLSDFDAMNFLEAFKSFSGNDKFWENSFGVIEAGSVVPGGKLLPVVTGGIRSAAKHGAKVGKIADEMGDVKTAAVETLKDIPVTEALDGNTLKELNPSIYDLDSLLNGNSKNSTALTAKLRDSVANRAEIMETLTKNNIGRDIDVLSESERATLAVQQIDDLQKVYKRTNDTTIDSKILEAANEPDNVDKISIILGKTNGDTLATEAAANNYKNRYIFHSDAKVVPVGADRWGIEITRPLNIDGLKSIKLEADQLTPERGAFGRWLYSDSYRSSLEQVKDKRVISDTQQFFDVAIQRMGEPIQRVKGNKKENKRFVEMLKMQQDFIDPVSKKRRWFTVEEFTDKYRENYGKLPPEDTVDAYLASVQVNDLDHMFRSEGLFRQKSRLGVSNIKVGEADEFEGIQRFELPSDDTFRVVAVDSKGKVINTLTKGSRGDKRDQFQRYMDDGWKLVQAYNGRTPFKGSTHVMVKAPKVRNLSVNEMVPYNPGGHLLYKNQWYIKQANVLDKDGKKFFDGDTSAFNIATEKQGRVALDKLEEARRLRNSGDEDAFNVFVRDNFPEVSANDWKRFNFDIPFTLTKAGSRTIDTPSYRQTVGLPEDYENPYDLSSQVSGKFLGERDDTLADALIVEGNSVVDIRPSEVINPLDSLQYGLASSLNERAMGDYIQKTSSNFIREFRDVLDVSEAQIRRNPLLVLTDPVFKENAPIQAVAKAKMASQAINSFLGTPTESSKALRNFKESLLDTAVNKWGADSKIAKVVEERLIHTVRDPFIFMRSAAFHAKLGLFNPKQLFLQSQIVTQIAAVGGVRNAMASVPAYAMTHSLGLTAKPGMVKHADKLMQKFNWKAGEFTESHNALIESGWDIVGSNISAKDTFEMPSLVGNGTSKFLDHGTFFFKKGDHIGRVMSWHVAYRNWRKANPGKKISREALEDIRLSASDMTANQTSDMNAQWQRGFTSVGTQFWGFQARLFEQMVSPASRLSAKQRVRLFGGISAMYGVPVGLGAGVMMWPVNESVKKYLVEQGLDEQVENNPALEAIRDGILSTGLEMMTGMDFDTANFGPAGNPFVKDILQGDKEWYEVFGGASAGVILDTMGPAMGGLKDILTFQVTEDDITDFSHWDVLEYLGTISSVNNATKFAKYMQTGQWISRNDIVQQDVTFMEAFTSSITGLNTEANTDIWLNKEILDEIKDGRKSAMQDVQKEYSRARRSMEAGDFDAAKKYFKRGKAAAAVGGLTIREENLAASRGLDPSTMSENILEQLHKEKLKKMGNN